ncbi:MAG: hypothetical protein ACI4V7_07075 [Succinivibrionaceae bacterium]
MLTQEYIGTIDPDKGLLPKKVLPNTNETRFVEFGLSNFILEHFKKDIIRSSFTEISEVVIYFSIIHYIYGHVEQSIKLSYLSKYVDDFTVIKSLGTSKRITQLSANIAKYIKEMFPVKSDRDYILELLRDTKIKESEYFPKINYSLEIKEILDKYGVKYNE